MSNIENFQKLVLKNITLQEQLKEATNLDSFAELAVKIGKEAGYNFTVEDIKSFSTTVQPTQTSHVSFSIGLWKPRVT